VSPSGQILRGLRDLVPLLAIEVFSSGGCSRGKCGLVLNRSLVLCIFRGRGFHLIHIWGRAARLTDETSLVQAVCRSSHGLGLGQVELLKHKVAESVKCVVYTQIFVR